MLIFYMVFNFVMKIIDNPPIPVRSVKLIVTKKKIEEVINFASQRNVVEY